MRRKLHALAVGAACAWTLGCGSGSSGGGTTGDGGKPTDSGTVSDSGAPVDSGTRSDGGPPTDGSVPSDTGSPVDTGSPPDGGACTNAPPPQSGGTTYYVGPGGSDSNPGTSAAAPFATIQHAADLVSPGDTVLVLDGTYTNPAGGNIVDVSRGGVAGNWVWFKSQSRWGAKLDGKANTDSGGWHFTTDSSGNPVAFVRIEGFEISGIGIGTLCGGCANGGAGALDAYAGGHDVQIIGNHIHDIGRLCTDTSNGEVGIFVEQPNVTIEQNLFHDIGRYANLENGCAQDNDYWQNHDHGIYVDGNADSSAPGASGTMIRNNIFYNNTHGWGVQVYPGTVVGLSILNNTFAFPNPNRTGQVILDATLTNAVVQNNLFYQPTTAAVDIEAVTLTNVLLANNMTTAPAIPSATAAGLTETNDTASTDPLFVNPSTNDFHLQATSPARSAGASLPNVLVDFDGCPRPVGSPYDLGGYQH